MASLSVSDNAPAATADINTFETAVTRLAKMPNLELLIAALEKLQAQIDDIQAQVNAL